MKKLIYLLALSFLFSCNGTPSEPVENANDFTGWADYTDTEYTVDNPFRISGLTPVVLPNNAGFIREQQKPLDIETFYQDSIIYGRNGDGLMVLVDFIAVPATNGATFVGGGVDIGGGIPILYPETPNFDRSIGEPQYIKIHFAGYTLDTWERNGGKVMVWTDGVVDIHSIRYVFTRTHKARVTE